MKLLAIRDLHVAHCANRDALKAIQPHCEDWLLLGGDIGEPSSTSASCSTFLSHGGSRRYPPSSRSLSMHA